MEKVMTRAFDMLTVEELDLVIPEKMSFELPADVFRRIQNNVLPKIQTAESSKNKEDQPSGKRHHHVKALLIAAIIVVLLAASAMAVYLNGGARFIEQLFGNRDYNMIEGYVMSDIAQARDEHLCLTLESALTDGHYYYVVFSVESIDGSSIEALFPDISFNFIKETPSRGQPAFQIEKMDTEENSNTKAFYIALIRSDDVITSMGMELHRLFALDNGEKAINCNLSVETTFLTCPIARGGIPDGVFRNVELSPFCLWVDVFEEWEHSDALSSGLPIYDVSIRFADGDTIGATVSQFADYEYMESIGWGGMQRPNGTNQSFISINFAGFVDIARVESVIIGSDEIPVSLDR